MKEKVFFGIGCFGVLGTIAMISEDIWGAVFYLTIAIIFFYISRNLIKKILMTIPALFNKDIIKELTNKKITGINNIKKFIDPQILPSLERDAKFRKEMNKNLVQVTSHGESCELCKKWENKILNDDVFISGKINHKYELLSNAIRQGLFHNGCKHGLTTYYPELKNISYDKPEQSILMVDEETGEVLGKIKK